MGWGKTCIIVGKMKSYYFFLFSPYIKEIILVFYFTVQKKYLFMQNKLGNSYKQKTKKLKLSMIYICGF